MPYKEKEITKMFHSISEVAEMFKVAQSLLRFWEKEFPTLIQPNKDVRGNRMYKEQDITNIRILHTLIKEQGFTLDGAKKHFRENKKENTEQEKILKSLQKIKEELLALKKQVASQ
jgi:DNA-binding transcriptional MerR regulator